MDNVEGPSSDGAGLGMGVKKGVDGSSPRGGLLPDPKKLRQSSKIGFYKLISTIIRAPTFIINISVQNRTFVKRGVAIWR